jgi:hypothetical protein
MFWLPERLFMNARITGPAASFPYVLHYPWATAIGSSGQ